MEINADIGEMTGADGEIMPHISIGNIACGYHASDLTHMRETVSLAMRHGVRISAHPGYRDKKNFGRVSLPHSFDEVVRLVEEQVLALKGICEEFETDLFAIKPHGALYHDMIRDAFVREAISQVAHDIGVPLIVQFLPDEVDEINWEVPVIKEVYADRAYDAKGMLVPRSQSGSLHENAHVIVEQAQRLMSLNEADILCFHGDHPASVEALKILHA